MLASQRALFEMPRDICYLNSASYSPLPLKTQEAARAAVGRKAKPWTLEPSFANTQHERARAAAARLIHADPADMALIPSISYGVATAAKIVRIERGTGFLEGFPLNLNREDYRGSLGRANQIRLLRRQRRGVRDGEGILKRPAGAGRLDRRGR